MPAQVNNSSELKKDLACRGFLHKNFGKTPLESTKARIFDASATD
jgi:hypothetical protein